MTERPEKKRNAKIGWKKKTLAVCVSTVMALLLGEVAVRLMGETDDDGNFLLRGRIVGQRHPHVEWVERANREYVEGTTKRMIYNPQTGWSPRPNASSHKGMYRYNSRGIRSAPTEYVEPPANDVLRIALFGDSFTHADDVPWEETWAAQLEEFLNEKSDLAGATGRLPASVSVRYATHPTATQVEVLNFGVSAYGMDQSFLRWQSLGKNYRPHIVIFGFQPENIARNVNILRGFYVGRTGIPFSKPRFVLDDDGHLKPINLPCLKPEDVPETMTNMTGWEFARQEFFYSPEKYRRRFWHFSRLMSLVADRVLGSSNTDETRRIDFYDRNSEPIVVSLKIVEEFRKEVEATGSEFFAIHLPRKQDIQKRLSGEKLAYEEVLEKLREQHSVIDPLPAFLKHAKSHSLDDLFVAGKRHYSEAGNRIVAHEITEHLKVQPKRQ